MDSDSKGRGRLDSPQDVNGAKIRIIDQMASTVYEALQKRQHCTACGGEGMVSAPVENPDKDPDLECIMVSSPCGCAKHADVVLSQFEAEYGLLAALIKEAQEVATKRALIENGLNGKQPPS